jgi:phosphoribosylglycinamide formyltransferase 1
MPNPIRIVVLLSGGGTTLENLFEHIDARGLPARVDLVVSSRADAYGLVRARNHGIETALVASRDHRRPGTDGRSEPDWEGLSKALNAVILPRQPDLVCFAGYMCKYILPPELAGRAMNVHPALIPAFCGHGMYGHHVHEAVVKAGVKVSGCTVHFVTNDYDAGPIVVQRTCPVGDADTPEDVQQRVFREECEAYPEAIRLFAEGRLRIEDSRVRVLPRPV